MIDLFSNNFKKKINNLVPLSNNFVLGLSGGTDSMALLHLLNCFLNNNSELNINIYVVIIDHNLRTSSSEEARKVHAVSTSLGFKTIIKKIIANKPKGNIQSWARFHRRNLLHDTAVEYSANLLLAHHYDDQVETVFMRLIRGSGIDGLLGIKESQWWNGIYIIRPLLIFKKEQLKSYVNDNNITFFDDPSNTKLNYERVRTRKIITIMRENFWNNISDDLKKFSDLNKKLLETINPFFLKWLEENISIENTGSIKINYFNLKTLFYNSNLLAIKILGTILHIVGGNEYSPKKKKTLHLLLSIFKFPFKNKSLGNVTVYLEEKFLFFIREQRNISFNKEIKENNYYVFDGRFLLISNVAGKLIKNTRNYFNQDNRDKTFYKYRNQINNSLPMIETLEGECIYPYLRVIDNNEFERDNIKDGFFGLYLINRLLL
jgi:tRNA(Ile)-lysidine synthase